MQQRSISISARLALASVVTTAAAVGFASPADASTGNSFSVRTLVTDATGAPVVDPALVNPWGMAQGPTSPVWVSNNGTDTSTLYVNAAAPKIPLTVTIPGGAPTGQVFNPTSGFVIPGGTTPAKAKFIFDSEAGMLTAWNQGTTAVATASVPTAVYKGLTIATSRQVTRLYATDFHNGRVDVFDSQWRRVYVRGTFLDPQLPQGYAPFGITTVRGQIYVSYAKQDADKKDDVHGRGNGYINIFTPTGKLLRRLVSRGHLNSPWAMVVAPAGYGMFGGDLLVGNFGDGTINAYNAGGVFMGTLRHRSGSVIVLPGLWGLLFGNGTSAARNALMFTSGPGGEQHGLWGVITSN